MDLALHLPALAVDEVVLEVLDLAREGRVCSFKKPQLSLSLCSKHIILNLLIILTRLLLIFSLFLVLLRRGILLVKDSLIFHLHFIVKLLIRLIKVVKEPPHMDLLVNLLLKGLWVFVAHDFLL